MTLKETSQIHHFHHHCPVCNTSDGYALGCLKYTLLDSNPLASVFNVVSCEKCGFVFCDTPSTQRDYDTFYEKSFYSSSYISRKLLADEKKYFAQVANILSQYIPEKDAAVFDIGCGVGGLLQTLNKSGYNKLYGVDPSSMCVELLNKTEGVQAACGSLADIPFGEEKADVIILSHIVEHILDLQDALQSIANKLTADGLVYVEVPDGSQYEAFEGVSPLRYFYFQHLIHFDRNHLVNLFAAHGFNKVASGHHVRVEGELQMPCVWGIFEKSKGSQVAVESDFQLAGQVSNWFSNINLDQDGILGRLAAGNSSVFVWGVGIHVQMMLAMSPLGQCNIKCFIDKDARNQGETINNKVIESLGKLATATAQDTVVIGAPTHSEEMYDYLINEVGFKGQVVVCGFGDVRVKQPETISK